MRRFDPRLNRAPWRAVLSGGLLYFATVFAVGFALGAARTIWISPRLGTSTAEILETPVTIFVSFLAAGWVIRRQAPPRGLTMRLGIGLLALGLMVAAEIGVVWRIRGLTLAAYLMSRDPAAFSLYLVSLVIFALMPALATPLRVRPPN